MVNTMLQCQKLCEAATDCLAVHFCAPCSDHNCRLLKDKQNGVSHLSLVTQYDFVDYSEMESC